MKFTLKRDIKLVYEKLRIRWKVRRNNKRYACIDCSKFSQDSIYGYATHASAYDGYTLLFLSKEERSRYIRILGTSVRAVSTTYINDIYLNEPKGEKFLVIPYNARYRTYTSALRYMSDDSYNEYKVLIPKECE